LWEDISRRQMEIEISRLREIERKSERAQADARESRERSFGSLAGPQNDRGAGSREWLTQEANWSMATGRRRRAEVERDLQQPAAEAAKEQFLSRHRERQQTEILLVNAEAKLREEQGRREQRSLDDWFQLRTGTSRERERPDGAKEAGDDDPIGSDLCASTRPSK
jgi:hypothetical protein